MYTNFSQKLSKYKSLAANGMRFDITVHNTGNSLSDRYVIENIMSIQTSSIREITVMLDKSKFDIGVQTYHMLKSHFPDIDIDVQLVFRGNHIDAYSDQQLTTYEILINDSKDLFFEVQLMNGQKKYLSHNQLYEITKCKFKRWLCNAGKDLLYIHSDGSVHRCDGYFYAKMPPLSTIYTNSKIQLLDHTFCKLDDCPFQDDVYKQRIFVN